MKEILGGSGLYMGKLGIRGYFFWGFFFRNDD